MTDPNDRLQEQLAMLEAGTPPGDPVNAADDETAGLVALASAIRRLPHPAPARSAAQIVEQARQRTEPLTRPGHRESRRLLPGLTRGSRWVTAGLFVVLIGLLAGAALLIARLSGTDSIAGPGDATASPSPGSTTEPPQVDIAPQPAAGKLAFVRGGNIWVVAVPDGEAQQVTDGQQAQNPRWSPSGDWLAYQSTDNSLWLVRAGDAEPVQIEAAVQGFAWSPVADQLAYAVENELRIAEVGDVPASTLVTASDSQRIDNLRWSPDGEWIAYRLTQQRGIQDVTMGIWKVATNGEDITELHAVEGSDDLLSGVSALAGWASDGSAVLFWGGNPFASASLAADGLPLFRLPTEGGEPQELTTTLLYEDYVRPRPAGSELAVIDGPGRQTWENKALTLFGADGSSTAVTPDGLAAGSPAWSPDGQQIAYVAMPEWTGEAAGPDAQRALMMGRGLWLYDVAVGQPHQLTGDENYRDEYPQWSADGRSLLFVRLDAGSQTSVQWMTLADESIERLADGPDLLTSTGGFGYYGYIDWSQVLDWLPGAGPTEAETDGLPTPSATPASAALTLPDGAEDGWLETDTAYPPTRAAFSPGGDLLATAHHNGTVIVWDLTTGERRYTFQGAVERSGEAGIALTDEVADITFSPDGSRLAAARPYVPAVDVWKVESGELLTSLEVERGVMDVAFSPDGSRLAAGITSGQSLEPAGETVIWDTAAWTVEKTLADAAPTLAFSPDGRTLATRSGVSLAVWTGQAAGPVRLWDVVTGTQRAAIPVDGFVMQLAYSPDGETLALNVLSPDEGAVTLLIDAESGEPQLSLPASVDGLDSLAFSPDGSLLVVGSQPNYLVGWDVVSGESLFELTGPADWLRYPAFSPDGALLAANSSDGRVLLWNVAALSAGAPDVVPTVTGPAGVPSDPPLDGLPADVEDWDTYSLPDAGITIPVPPGWEVTEWSASDDASFSASVSIQPGWESAEGCGYQCPEIGVTVWLHPEGETLRDWLDAHSTAVPFGTETGSETAIEFYGVENVVETTLGGKSALGFTHDAMGIQVYTVISEAGGSIVGLSKTHVGQFPLGPVFEMMRVHTRIWPPWLS